MAPPSPASPIPIISLSTFTHPSTPSSRLSTAQDLAATCRSVGFVYITDHGVPASKVADAFDWSKKLFALRKEDKMKALHPPGSAVHRGYSYPGLEKVSDILAAEVGDEGVQAARNVPDFKESYEIGSEDYADQPNQWLPEEVLPGFRHSMTAFYWECERFTRVLLQALALGIGLDDEDYLRKFHSGHENQLRLLHYPAVAAETLERGLVKRMPAHTDWGTLTILFQDGVGGLEIEDPNEKERFVKAAPVEGSVVMNVGDLLQRWSNGMSKLLRLICVLSWQVAVLIESYIRLPEIHDAPRRSSKGVTVRRRD